MSVRRAVKAKTADSNNLSNKRTRRSTKSRPKTSRRGGSHSRPVVPPRPEPKAVPAELPKAPEEEVARFTASLDRRIIEGMLEDRELLMRQMSERGITEASVLRRAAELGLSEALLRQVKGVAADLAGERPGVRRHTPSALGARTCLSCDRIFLSTGPGNRLCMRCRGGDAGLAQM